MIASLFLAVALGVPVRSGSMVASSPRFIDEPPAAIASAANGGSILATWRDNNNVAVARLYPWLLADRSSAYNFALQPDHTASSNPQIATDGSEYLVAWSEVSSSSQFDAVAARFDLDGRLLEGPTIVRRGSTESATLMLSNGVYKLAFGQAIYDIAPHSI